MTTCSALRSKAWCTLDISQWPFLLLPYSANRGVILVFIQSSSGALKRSKLEKLEPSISYEAFVEELDTGDWFTTTLTELLVRVRQLSLLSHASITNNGHNYCRKWLNDDKDKQPTVG